MNKVLQGPAGIASYSCINKNNLAAIAIYLAMGQYNCSYSSLVASYTVR